MMSIICNSKNSFGMAFPTELVPFFIISFSSLLARHCLFVRVRSSLSAYARIIICGAVQIKHSTPRLSINLHKIHMQWIRTWHIIYLCALTLLITTHVLSCHFLFMCLRSVWLLCLSLPPSIAPIQLFIHHLKQLMSLQELRFIHFHVCVKLSNNFFSLYVVYACVCFLGLCALYIIVICRQLCALFTCVHNVYSVHMCIQWVSFEN